MWHIVIFKLCQYKKKNNNKDDDQSCTDCKQKIDEEEIKVYPNPVK